MASSTRNSRIRLFLKQCVENRSIGWIDDGKLVTLSDNGRPVIAKADPREFVEQANTSILKGRCQAVPELLNGHVYARNARGKLVYVKLPPSKKLRSLSIATRPAPTFDNISLDRALIQV